MKVSMSLRKNFLQRKLPPHSPAITAATLAAAAFTAPAFATDALSTADQTR